MSEAGSAAREGRAIGDDLASAALVLCSHGVGGRPGGVLEHAAAIRARGLFAEVHGCAHKGRPGLVETLREVRAPVVYLAPLLMAEGYTLAAMLHRLEALGPDRVARVCPPLGTRPELAGLMAASAGASCAGRGWRSEETGLLIVGHGTERHAGSGITARRHAAAIAARHRFAQVAVAFLDQRPGVAEGLAALPARHKVAVGFFVDAGEHGRDDVPRLLAGADPAVAYAGAIGNAPAVADLVVLQVRQRAGRPLAA